MKLEVKARWEGCLQGVGGEEEDVDVVETHCVYAWNFQRINETGS